MEVSSAVYRNLTELIANILPPSKKKTNFGYQVLAFISERSSVLESSFYIFLFYNKYVQDTRSELSHTINPVILRDGGKAVEYSPGRLAGQDIRQEECTIRQIFATRSNTISSIALQLWRRLGSYLVAAAA